MEAIEEYKKRLLKIEAELEKVRGCSPLTHGWQTQRLAKSQRKWDELAKERIFLINEIEEFEKIKSREECPAKMICQCGKGGNWDGYCKLKNNEDRII